MKKIICVILVLSFVATVFSGCGSSASNISDLSLSEENVEAICKKIVKQFNKNGDSIAELIEVSTVQYHGPYIEADFLIKTGLTENKYDISFYPVSETDIRFSRAYIQGYRGDTNETRIQEHECLVSAFETVVFGKTAYEENRIILRDKVYNDEFKVNEDCEILYPMTDSKNVSYTARVSTNYGRCDFFDYKISKN